MNVRSGLVVLLEVFFLIHRPQERMEVIFQERRHPVVTQQGMLLQKLDPLETAGNSD